MKLIMVSLWEYLIEQLKKHGLPMVMLTLAVYYFYQEKQVFEEKTDARMDVLDEKIEKCQEDRIKMYREGQQIFVDVIKSNSGIMTELKNNQIEIKNLVKKVVDK